MFSKRASWREETREAICFVSLVACTVLVIKYAAGHNNKLNNSKLLSAVSAKHNLPELKFNCRLKHTSVAMCLSSTQFDEGTGSFSTLFSTPFIMKNVKRRK